MDEFGGEFGESYAGDIDEENEDVINGIEDDAYDELMTHRIEGVPTTTPMTTQLVVQRCHGDPSTQPCLDRQVPCKPQSH